MTLDHLQGWKPRTSQATEGSLLSSVVCDSGFRVSAALYLDLGFRVASCPGKSSLGREACAATRVFPEPGTPHKQTFLGFGLRAALAPLAVAGEPSVSLKLAGFMFQ